ncbi:MAG: UDP-4-amino-4,6-dideoxy-N-acetyl-beta-L-altrosamine transaminase [Kofleriaceae bacterium]
MADDKRFLPYGQQVIDEDDIAAVVSALRSPLITQGPRIAEFEAALAAYTSAPHATVVANGTIALQLAYAALGLEAGDEIITTPNTFAATANAARALGAEVRFCDVEPDTGNMDVASVEALVTPRTRGIVPVHFGGLPVDLAAVHTLAQRHHLWIVEDAAHALGATYRDQPVGACRFSDATTFSFHPVKHLTTGEGGAITVRDPALKRHIDRLRHHGIEREHFSQPSPGPWYHEVVSLGWNGRLTDIQAALGISQLRKQPSWLARRRELAAVYRQRLAELGPHVTLQATRPERESAFHLLPALIDFDALGSTRAHVMNALRARNIGTQVHYIPVDSQPYYRGRYGDPPAHPGMASFYARELSLPMFASLDADDVTRVVRELASVLGAT